MTAWTSAETTHTGVGRRVPPIGAQRRDLQFLGLADAVELGLPWAAASLTAGDREAAGGG
jgi:hypothetical protein